MISEAVRAEYWNHFTDESHRVFRPKKITDVRLKFIKKEVLGDNSLWQKMFSRDHALDKTPSQLKETSPSNYRETRMDFWAMIRQKIKGQLLAADNLSGEPI